MNDDFQIVLEKDRKRFKVLKFIYDNTHEKDDPFLSFSEISYATEIPGEELIHILEYLQNERLIKAHGSIHGGGSTPVQILHQGVREIEAAIKKPDESTEHFLTQIFNVTNNASVAQQQFGNENILNVNQRDLTEVASEIHQLLQQSEQKYPTKTFTEKVFVVEEAIKQIESNPTLKARSVGMLKSAGKEAFKEAIDHPLVNILMAGIEGWQEGS